LSKLEYPEKWVFTCTKDFKVLLGAQPLGALHTKFPFSVIPLEPEGYGLFTRGIPEIIEPVQNTVDWLINSHFYNVRAVLNNKVVVDPSRVVMKDFMSTKPGGVVRLKPEAYGTNPEDAWSQLTIGDVTQGHLNDFQTMLGVGERTVGINDQIMGMLATGGRKTATEVRTSTSFGVNRLKTIAEWMSEVGVDPLSMMLVQNTQQYYDGEQKFKIAGDLLSQKEAQFMTVTPDLIAGNYNFVPIDGTLPVDRQAQANLWKELFVQMRNFPQLMLRYDMGGIFEHIAQLAGLRNIKRFRVEQASNTDIAAAVHAGNIIPLSSGNSTNSTTPNAPRQLPGQGPTV
jgi:hypothetical protein